MWPLWFSVSTSVFWCIVSSFFWCAWCHLSLCLQAARVTSGDLTAAIGASAKMGLSVTPSQVPVSALMGTRDGVVRSPVSMVIMARRASYHANVSMVPPATTRQESASVHRATQGLCEYHYHIYSFGTFYVAMWVCISNFLLMQRTAGKDRLLIWYFWLVCWQLWGALPLR